MKNILLFVKSRLDSISYKELEVVSADTGIPYGTLMKIKSGETENPRIKTVQVLLDHFDKKQKNRKAA